jgi:GGDEF domain-containing protein
MLVLPETNAADARNILTKIKNDFTADLLPDSVNNEAIGLNIGISEWQKGNDGRLLMKRTMDALAEAKEAEATLTN